jgi:hypothetical protein
VIYRLDVYYMCVELALKGPDAGPDTFLYYVFDFRPLKCNVIDPSYDSLRQVLSAKVEGGFEMAGSLSGMGRTV